MCGDAPHVPLFAPVGSLEHLWELLSVGRLGSYHLLLAHKVLEDIEGWREFYSLVRRSSHPFVIMDNSLVELGHPVEVEDLYEAYKIVDASCIVLADKLGDAYETMKMSQEMLRDLALHTSKMPPTMGVVQGTDVMELIDCANFFGERRVTYLSVPRVVTNTLGSRLPAIEAITNLFPRVSLHLLGFSDNLEDDIKSARSSTQIMGIDSAAPIKLAEAGIPMSLDAPKVHRRDAYLDYSLGYTPLVGENVDQVRQWLCACGDENNDV